MWLDVKRQSLTPLDGVESTDTISSFYKNRIETGRCHLFRVSISGGRFLLVFLEGIDGVDRRLEGTVALITVRHTRSHKMSILESMGLIVCY